MAQFFSTNRGRVVRVGESDTGAPSPLQVKLQNTDLGSAGADPTITSPNMAVIITQLRISAAGNTHVQHAADETVYAYTFGDRIGEFTLGGVCFSRHCWGTNGGESGPAQLFRIYRDNRVAARGTPCQLKLGAIERPIAALLLGLTFEVVDPASELSQWGMRFLGLTGGIG